jgi:large subunit ribosomal protein L22
MKVQATLKNLRITPRKVRLVTHSVIGLDAREALVQLEKQIKKSVSPIYDLLKSAMANAVNNNGLDETNLYVWEIRVGDGLRLKRWLPRAFGRATPLLRRGSNVTVILEERIEGKNRVAKKKEIIAPASVSEKSEELEKEEIKAERKTAKPEIKKELVKGAKPAVGQTVKKMFQRKSM